MSSAAPSSFQTSLASKQKTLLRRYVDLAYLKEELIMRGVSTGAAVGTGVADFFVGIATPVKATAEAIGMGSARAARRAVASNLYAAINGMSAQQVTQTLNAMHSELARKGGADAKDAKAPVSNETPDMAMLQKHIPIGAAARGAGSGSAAVQAAAGAGAAAPSVVSTVGEAAGEIFIDFLSDSVGDTILSFIPLAGAISGGMKLGNVIDRVAVLEKEIEKLRKQGA